ncbi:hypothetical protein C8J56DRAFT_1170984, partial [Mycena floridula]
MVDSLRLPFSYDARVMASLAVISAIAVGELIKIVYDRKAFEVSQSRLKKEKKRTAKAEDQAAKEKATIVELGRLIKGLETEVQGLKNQRAADKRERAADKREWEAKVQELKTETLRLEGRISHEKTNVDNLVRQLGTLRQQLASERTDYNAKIRFCLEFIGPVFASNLTKGAAVTVSWILRFGRQLTLGEIMGLEKEYERNRKKALKDAIRDRTDDKSRLSQEKLNSLAQVLVTKYANTAIPQADEFHGIESLKHRLPNLVVKDTDQWPSDELAQTIGASQITRTFLKNLRESYRTNVENRNKAAHISTAPQLAEYLRIQDSIGFPRPQQNTRFRIIFGYHYTQIEDHKEEAQKQVLTNSGSFEGISELLGTEESEETTLPPAYEAQSEDSELEDRFDSAIRA